MPYNILGDLQTLTLSPSATCDNPCCILTINNTVQLMGNVSLTNYDGGKMIATLPESMRPNDTIVVPVYLHSNIDATDNVLIYMALNIVTEIDPMNLVPLTVSTDGEISIPMNVTTGILYLNGLEFNVCDRYYNSSIGNNFSQGTSPLRWDSEEY